MAFRQLLRARSIRKAHVGDFRIITKVSQQTKVRGEDRLLLLKDTDRQYRLFEDHFD
jgi:hypothetical protein